MPESQSLQRILAQAKKKEKRYDWLGAVEFHKKALDQVLKQKDLLKAGGVQERIGYCFHRGAMQAKSQQEFRGRCAEAIENYEKSKEFYGKLREPEETPRVLRCDAMIAYVKYWHSSEASEKKRLIDECWRLTRECLRAFAEADNPWEYGKTYNQLSRSALLGFFLEWDFQALSILGDPYELTKAYAKTATYLQVFGYDFLDLDEREKYYQKAQGYWLKAKEFSEETAMVESLNPELASDESAQRARGGVDEALMYLKKALEYGKKTKDRYTTGCALDLLAYHTTWKSLAIEDPDEITKLRKRVLEYAEDAKSQYSTISFTSPRGDASWVEAAHRHYYWAESRRETNLRKKRDLLEKAMKLNPDILKRAEDSRYPEIMMYARYFSTCILTDLAKIETNPEGKKRLLEKAVEHINETIRLAERITPFMFWNLGVFRTWLANTKFELANLAKDPETRKKMLQEAILDKENSQELRTKHAMFYEKRGVVSFFSSLGLSQYEYGDMLIRLYESTNNSEHLKKAIEAFEEATESFQKLNLISRMAECYWKTAQTYDTLGDNSKAAESFNHASDNYKSAAEKIPQLKAFYLDHALYMQAWSEIEKAKNHHKGRRYDKAKLHYEKAANLHKSTQRWNYLSSNYHAWTLLEEAEHYSRRERTEEARDLFQQAANLLLEAKKSIEAELEKIEVRDEKEMAAELIKASEIRREYLLGRIAVEEAKILDRRGDHIESSKKYGLGAEIFEKIAEVEPEQSRKELRPIIFLCRAWQKMMIAEAKASSTTYGEAAELFKQAKEHTLDQPTSLLALANSSFCKALGAGTEFEITRDTKTYSTAKKHLGAAENYYLKAGFKTASEYAKATYMLFDAYIYTHKAETETNPRRKAQYYRMAEKLLQASAASYTKAKHPEKSEEVQRLLESAIEKRQLAMSLTEVLHAPTIASTTTSFSTPTPTHEKAVGLERFEHADIQANLTVSEEVAVGEEVEVRLDLVNVAKNFGLLVRVDDLIPPVFKVTALPSHYNIENGSIDMKGKRLEPLKVESIKFSLQATEAGDSSLSPQVIYVDEVGEFRTCRPEPVSVTVHPKLAFEFKTKAAQRAFDFLVSSFVEDYMRRRISLEKSGWRTLMAIVKHGKVSKSSVYGAGGRRGRAVSELERRGLVETRVFLGERGRGGRILKMRVCYERETIKRHIDQGIMKIKEK